MRDNERVSGARAREDVNGARRRRGARASVSVSSMAAMGTWVEISWRACLALAFGVYTRAQRHAKLLPVASKRTSFDSSVGRAFDCSGYMDHRMVTGFIGSRDDFCV